MSETDEKVSDVVAEAVAVDSVEVTNVAGESDQVDKVVEPETLPEPEVETALEPEPDVKFETAEVEFELNTEPELASETEPEPETEPEQQQSLTPPKTINNAAADTSLSSASASAQTLMTASISSVASATSTKSTTSTLNKLSMASGTHFLSECDSRCRIFDVCVLFRVDFAIDEINLDPVCWHGSYEIMLIRDNI